MTPFDIESLPFDSHAVRRWTEGSPRRSNWPVVYLLDAEKSGALQDIYVGETLNAGSRLQQHLASVEKRHLQTIRVIVDETFNKSACLDLESFLIRLLSGDGRFRVLNRNDGITDADYYDRRRYQQTFNEVFDRLREQGVFSRSIPQIENDDLFKLSPFKALNRDQAAAVEDILEGLFADLALHVSSSIVIQGAPGTGKTVVGIFIMKLLVDVMSTTPDDERDADSVFSDFFAEGYRELLQGLRLGLVVPQQSLRRSIKRVFKKTPGLHPNMVLSPFEVGKAPQAFDLLIVDETHRLNQRANQPSAAQNASFRDINGALFGYDDVTKTQLDWIRAKSTHQLYLLDTAQSVRPADLPPAHLNDLVRTAVDSKRHFRLFSQMRVRADFDYVAFIRGLLDPVKRDATVPQLGDYSLRLFDDLGDMHDLIKQRDDEYGLARLVAGYAWEWKSKNDPTAHDIELDGRRLQWNRTDTDWISSPGAIDEVGSIHTVQGYDLNFVGVVIGPELRYNASTRRLFVDRAAYADKKGKENNPKLGLVYSDDDLLQYVRNIYGVLLTRGIRGTYVYVCDPGLRQYFSEALAVTALGHGNGDALR